MSKKVSFEDIYLFITSYSWKVKSTEYKNAKEHLLLECPNGHQVLMNWSNFKSGKRCSYCAKNKKYLYEEVFQYFLEQGCFLLSNSYINCKTPLEYICNCGEKSKTTFDNFKNKHERCKKCGVIKASILHMIPYSSIKNIIEMDGNTLITLEENYINTNNNIEILCPCGEIFKTTIAKYKMRKYKTCLNCTYKILSQNKSLSFKELQDCFKQYDLDIIDAFVLDNKKYINFICFCGKQEIVLLDNLRQKSIKKCKQCTENIRAKNSRKYNIKQVQEIFKNNNCILISDDFKNIDEPLDYICECGNKSKISLYNFMQGQRCGECKRKKISGKNHWNWQGGITSDNQTVRNSLEYKTWRNSIFQQDNYTCQCCGDNSGGNLEAHHINNFSSNENLRFDVDNGITLCNVCHNPYKYGSFHNIYGTRNNTPEQLYEYIQRYKNGEFDELRKLNDKTN